MFAFFRRPGRVLAVVGVFAVASPVYAQTAAVPQAQEKPAAAELPAAQAIVDRFLESVGGRKALQTINSIHIVGTMTVPANGMSGSIEVFSARPNKRLVKNTIAGIGDTREGFDGTHAWSMTPMTGPMLHTGEELKQQANDANFDALLDPNARYSAMKTLEKTTFDGKEVYKVSLTRKEGGEDIEYYDVSTGLKAGAVTSRKTPMGTISVTSTISDYKKFGDLLQPTQMKQSITGIDIITTISSIEYNKVDPAVFELPAEIKALIK